MENLGGDDLVGAQACDAHLGAEFEELQPGVAKHDGRYKIAVRTIGFSEHVLIGQHLARGGGLEEVLDFDEPELTVPKGYYFNPAPGAVFPHLLEAWFIDLVRWAGFAYTDIVGDMGEEQRVEVEKGRP